MAYTILSIVFFAILVSLPIVFGISFALSKRKIEFVRKFKKGLFVVIYIVAIPLFFMGFYYESGKVLASFFRAIPRTISLVVLGFDMDGIGGLMASEIWYTIAIYTCFVLVTINNIILVFSFLYHRTWELIKKKSFDNCISEDKLIIVGNNEESHNIYKSYKNGKSIILDELSKEEKESLYLEDIAYISKENKEEQNCVCELLVSYLDEHFTRYENVTKSIAEYENQLKEAEEKKDKKKIQAVTEALDALRKLEKQELSIIINTKDDQKNLEFCQAIKGVLHKAIGETDPDKELSEEEQPKREIAVVGVLSKAKIFVFGTPEYETLYNSVTKNAFGCITYINKYRQIAMDLQAKYPLTEFMTDKQIDYSTATIKDEININVFLIGFGKTNHQVFLASVANNQFLTVRNGELALKQVNYHVFDKHAPGNRKNLNHSYYRFKNEFEAEIKEPSKKYLDLPALPSQDFFHPYDINSPKFYKCIEETVKNDKNSYNYFIIAFSNDLENIDMAQKLLDKKKEWGLDNSYVFVKVRKDYSSLSMFNGKNCFVFGNEKSVAFDFEKISNNEITNMAFDRNSTYAIEYEIKESKVLPSQDEINTIIRRASFDWYKSKTEFERDSSRYAVINLRTKLHLMGLDYVPINDTGDLVDKDEYLRIYDKENRIKHFDTLFADIGGTKKKIVEYNNDIIPSLRTTLATQEHYRWNSYMISIGFVPASKKQIKDERMARITICAVMATLLL